MNSGAANASPASSNDPPDNQETDAPPGRKPPEMDIISVSALLALENLHLPDYQRPYKWSEENVMALLRDVQTFRHKSAYRLGVIVFHQEEGTPRNIVDGQQRILTLFLVVKAIMDTRQGDGNGQQTETQAIDDDAAKAVAALKEPVTAFLQNRTFISDISKRNLRQNYLAACRAVARQDFGAEEILFLLTKCQVVTFTLFDIGEAFQFFDSQNARGQDLKPHDLLKAYHLREFPAHEADRKKASVDGWEKQQKTDLASLFSDYLYPIRQYCQGKSGLYFGKDHIGGFKGVNLDWRDPLPYTRSLQIAHRYIDNYNQGLHFMIDGRDMAYPFQLDQTIINGRRFFEMVGHYLDLRQQMQDAVDRVPSPDKAEKAEDLQETFMGQQLQPMAWKILAKLETYEGRNRTGDRYIRQLFDAALFFYIDKFGPVMLSQVIEKLFVWAFRRRLIMHSVYQVTADNHVLQDNMMERINRAITPHDVTSWSCAPLVKKDLKGKGKDLESLFTELKYYDPDNQ